MSALTLMELFVQMFQLDLVAICCPGLTVSQCFTGVVFQHELSCGGYHETWW